MRHILSLIILPLPILYFLLTGAFIAFILKCVKTGKILFVISGFWFLIISTPLVPKNLVKILEDQYPQLTEEIIKSLPDSGDIIVLGGGHSDDMDLSPNNQLSTTALGRVIEGIRIHRMIPGSRLVLSGYSGGSKLSQALILYRTALILGEDSSSMIMLAQPSNTRMEAEEYAKYAGTENKLIIVTSDLHMPRAMMLFRKAGLDPIAAPTNQILKYGTQKYRMVWFPSSGNIGMMEDSIHEYAGILWALFGGS